MKQFLKVYRKELRFIAGPGIALIVLLSVSFLIFILVFPPNSRITSKFDFYFGTILMIPFQKDTLIVVFGLFFSYLLLSEHVTKTRQQLLMLPIPRWWSIASKIAAVMTWCVVTEVIIIMLFKILPQAYPSHPFPFKQMLINLFQFFSKTAFIVSIVLLGYNVGNMYRRISYLAGTLTIIFGYALVELLRKNIDQYLRLSNPLQLTNESAIYQVIEWFNIFFPVLAALMFIIPTLYLYEKYSEV